MRIAKIIGTVTLTRCHPSFRGASLKMAVPRSLDNLQDRSNDEADTIVVWDSLGAGVGEHIAMSEGGEAAQPFRPELKPVDAYNAAILDQIHLS